METRKLIKVEGRRWFQRSAGNTYHRVRLHYSNGDVVKSYITYGYGDSYLQTVQTAADLAMHELPKPHPYHPAELLSAHGVLVEVRDVKRKRDL